MALSLIPSISVVIPAYNRANTIRRCLDSVLAQTVSPLEIIVVDDRSTDETVQIVQNYTDPKVRIIILEKNSGAQVARNRGIREAKGDWIAFQDSDDEWLPNKLEKQICALEGVDFDPWTVVHSNAVWLDTTNGQQLPVELPIVEGEDVYPTLLSKPGPLFPTILASRLALDKINYLDENVSAYQEWDTSIRLAKYCRFVYLKEPLFIYRLHPGETISKNKNKEIFAYQYILDKYEGEIKKVCGESVWEQHLVTQAAKCLDFKLWDEADRLILKLSSNNIRYWVLRIFRALHLSPLPLIRLRQTILGG